MIQDLKSDKFETRLVVELKIRLDLIEGSHEELWKAHEDMKSTHDSLLAGQECMSTMMSEMRAFMKQFGGVCGREYDLEG
jgi:hypothetical protein